MANPGGKQITLTYLNIRQSIAILLARLFLVDFLMAFLVILSYFMVVTGGNFINYTSANTPLFLTIFIALGIIKIATSSYVILQWLNEYYEITPDYVVHKKGIIFKKSEQYRLNNVRAMDVEDSFLGEMFNFATITLYDIRLQKYLDMYLIHNPRRYAKVLQELRPHLETRKDRINLPFMPKEEEESLEKI